MVRTMLKEEKIQGWKIKTEAGSLYESQDLHALVKWVLENRLNARDLVFSPLRNDWIPLFMIPELKNCFWQLLASSGKVYGPLSLGELKQLSLNKQIELHDKISPWGCEQWSDIADNSILSKWFTDEYVPESYLHLLADLSGLEDKSQEASACKYQIESQIEQIHELEVIKQKLEKELHAREAESKKIAVAHQEILPQYETIAPKLQKLELDLQEKDASIEDLSKQISQLEKEIVVKDNCINEIKSKYDAGQAADGSKALENNELKQGKESLQKELMELQAKYADLETAVDINDSGKDEVVTGLNKERVELQTQVDNLDARTQELSREKESLSAEHEEVLVSLQQAIEQQQNEKKSLNESLASQERAFGILRDEEAALKLEITRLHDEILVKHNEVEQLSVNSDTEKKILDSKVWELTNELGRAHDVITDKDENLSVFENDLNQIKKDTELKNAQLQALMTNQNQLLEEIKTINDSSTEEQLQAQQTVQLTGQLEERDKTINDLREELQLLTEEGNGSVQELEGKLSLIKIEYEQKLQQQVDNYQNELLDKRNNWETEQKQNRDEWTRLLKEKEEQIAAQGRELDGLQEGLKTHQEQGQTQENKWQQQLSELTDEYQNKQAEWEQKLTEKETELTAKSEAIDSLQKNIEDERAQAQQETQGLRDRINDLNNSWEQNRAEWEQKLTEKETELTAKSEAIDSLQKNIEDERTQTQLRWQENETEWRSKVDSLSNELQTTRHNLEAELADKEAQIEGKVAEVGQLQNQLQEQTTKGQQEIDNLHHWATEKERELTSERDAVRNELTQKIDEITGQMGAMQQEIDRYSEQQTELSASIKKLEHELVQREQFIQTIEKEANQQQENYHQEITAKELKLQESYQNNSDLEGKVGGLEEQIKEIVATKDKLQEELSSICENLTTVRSELDQSMIEKANILQDLENERESFKEQRDRIEQEHDEMKRNWEQSVEESRNLQRQFYQEKQKMVKEYTETINKQARLEKRSQLEREINDRLRIKGELERLNTFIKENLDGLQRGSGEIGDSMEKMQEEIDNKNLSLKHIFESEKRETKKSSFPSRNEAANGNQENTPATTE